MPAQLYIHIAEVGIAFLAGLYSFRGLNKSLKILFIFTGLAFVTEISGSALIAAGIKNTIPGLHFYIILEFFLWALFYKSVLHPFFHKKIIIAIIILFESYAIINLLFIQDLFTMPNLVRSVEGLLLVLFSILLFSKFMVESKHPEIQKEPIIWINTAVLIYFSGNFFFNILFNLILENSREFSKVTTYFFTGLNGLFYFLIAFGFLLQKKYHSKN
ncbi:MAG: hypothetical protein ACQETJ_11030 [Bacteroidota bacterium]